MQIADHTVTTADGPMRLYQAVPDGDPRGALVVVQEAFGVNEHIEDVTRRAADAGYHAVAPAYFHRAGGGTAGYGKMDQVMPLYEGLDDAGVLVDTDAALDHLRAAGHSDEHIGVVGFCWGGRITFLLAVERRLGAAVGFYGGGIAKPGRFEAFPALIGRVGEMQTPWLGLFGDDDHAIPIDDVEELRTALASAPVDTEIVRYAGAGHGFHCDARPDFRPDAAKDAWQRTLDWFDRYL